MPTDCTRCAALCCLALAFDTSLGFAFDKPAGEPCPELRHHRCGIHGQRAARGLRGCETYDCGGAGERVTQEAFGGDTWRREPKLRLPMIEAFAQARDLTAAQELLTAAASLPLDPVQAQRRRALAERIEGPWTQPALDELTQVPLAAARAFVKSLRPRRAAS